MGKGCHCFQGLGGLNILKLLMLFFFLKSTFSPPHGYILTWNWVSGHGDQPPPPALPNLTLLQGAA